MNQLESNVLRLIGENPEAPDVFTDDATGMAQIRGSLNDAIQELCLVTGAYQRTYNLALLANRQFYRLAPQLDFIAYPVEVWDRANHRKLEQTSLAKLNREDPFWMQVAGTVTKYLWLGLDHIGIYRKPSAKGTILEIKCVCVPKPYSDGNSPIKLRPVNQRAAVFLAVSEFYASRGDANRATEYLQKYLETGDLMALQPQQNERQWRTKTNDSQVL
jgi:hypothetical protein